MKNVFMSWKNQTNELKQFKQKVKKNLVKRVFLALESQCSQLFKLRLFEQRRINKIKVDVIIGLLQNLERCKRLRH